VRGRAFEGHAFVEQVIRRRSSFLALNTSELDQESFQCLQLLIELGPVPPPYDKAKEKLDTFRLAHDLHLTSTVQPEARWGVSDTRGSFGWVTLRTPRRAAKRNTLPECRLSAEVIRRVTGLRSLESLVLSTLAPDAVSVLAELTGLRTLAFTSEHPCDLQSLTRLTGLTRLELSGTGVIDLSPLAGLPGLINLELSHFQGTTDEVAKLNTRLSGLRVQLVD
jgi:hypothetical protein